MQQDSSNGVTSTSEEMEDGSPDETATTLSAVSDVPASQRMVRFDWSAPGVVALIGAIFAVLGHLNAQPNSSLVPVAVMSATGSGLLVTGLRKRLTFKGAGIPEAALSGLLLAIFQFVSALSFPGVTSGLSLDTTSRPGFFTTWVLVLVFSILFSIIGAALGHLIFAPPRPLPTRTKKTESANSTPDEESALEQDEDIDRLIESTDETKVEEEMPPIGAPEKASGEIPPARSDLSSIISIVLLGLAPFLAGYVFAAAFDVALNLNQYDAGPFPTLRLLSTLLPWQVPLPINLQMLNLTLAWRIPILPGNPGAFDVQALEPFLLNATGLAFALLALFRFEHRSGQYARRNLLLLEALLGLVLVLPADLWITFGLHGLLQLPGISVPLRTLQLLSPLTFTLNLITGAFLCLLVGVIIASTQRNSTKEHRQ